MPRRRVHKWTPATGAHARSSRAQAQRGGGTCVCMNARRRPACAPHPLMYSTQCASIPARARARAAAAGSPALPAPPSLPTLGNNANACSARQACTCLDARHEHVLLRRHAAADGRRVVQVLRGRRACAGHRQRALTAPLYLVRRDVPHSSAKCCAGMLRAAGPTGAGTVLRSPAVPDWDGVTAIAAVVCQEAARVAATCCVVRT